MSPTDEELLHRFYAGDAMAIWQLAERHNQLLWQIAFLILEARTGSAVQASGEWHIDDRLVSLWSHVAATQNIAIGAWPQQRLSALTWLIYLLTLEMDRHLGLSGPF